MSASTEHQILSILAREWDFKGPPGVLDISEIVAALPLAPSEVLAGVKELFARGLVDMNAIQTTVFLTPDGYEAVSTADPGNGV